MTNTDKLLSALEAAKREFKPLQKNGKNNFFKTQNGVHEYSTLVDIKNATDEALNKNDLSLYYTITFENDLQFLTTEEQDSSKPRRFFTAAGAILLYEGDIEMVRR